MRAVTYRAGSLQLEDVPRPVLTAPDEALVRITTSAICGSDLHIARGLVPGMRDGSTVGHEYVGVVDEVGGGVESLEVGERVLGSCMIPCGWCQCCLAGAFGRCPTHRVLGYGAYTGDLDGAQAEYVKVPTATLALKPLRGSLALLPDERVLPLGDVLTSGLDVALSARIEAGDVVIVQGLGPVGLFALQAVLTFSPQLVIGVDPNPLRRAKAQALGALTLAVADEVTSHTPYGLGADVVLECVGGVLSLEQALASVRPGGRVSVIGVQSEMQWTTALAVHFARGVELKFCGTANIVGLWDRAFTLLHEGSFDTESVISHVLALDDALEGYALLQAGDALKVLLRP
jgi:threonine dehydrogenase-like Zn-dependent dehydrogenase